MSLGGADLSKVKITLLTNCEFTIESLSQLSSIDIRTLTYPSGISKTVLEACHPIRNARFVPKVPFVCLACTR